MQSPVAAVQYVLLFILVL